ncbi:MAG TPA: glycosyltransferase [Chitinophagales bacterium]|nr:glycosyltransferase [Chitinophagales bacterium]
MSIYLHYWNETQEFIPSSKSILPSVSIVIPVRNEEQHIAQLIQDLLAQDYPARLLEIIVVDDHSEDSTSEIVQNFQNERVRLIALDQYLLLQDISTAYKKKAIEAGVQSTQGELIMTTDGDCRVSSKWVSTMVSIWSESGAKLLTGAVVMTDTDTLFKKFQSLDFMGMMGITAAMLKLRIYNMANGANLLYEKSAFLSVDGFKGIDHIASGDDMLLMYKIAQKYNGAVAYAKHRDAVVYTQTMSTLKDFLHQRFRWTAKSKDYQDQRMTWILGSVFFFVVTLVMNFFGAFFSTHVLYLLVFQIVIKVIADFRLLKSTSQYYGRGYLMNSFFSSQLMHIVYIVFVGSLGNLLKFDWKGRTQAK